VGEVKISEQKWLSEDRSETHIQNKSDKS